MAKGEAAKPAPNLWDHATPEEVERLRELARGVQAAELDIKRIATKTEEVDQTITALSVRRYANRHAAAARALGEEPALAQHTGSPPVDRDELGEQLAGLRERLKGAEDRLSRQRGALRAAVVELVRVIATERIAPEYVRLTDGLADAFAKLMSAEELVMSLAAVTGNYGAVRHLADRMTWGKLYLPGSTDLPAITKRSHDEWSLPCLLVGETALQQGVGTAALARFKDSVTAEVGFWPFNQ